VEVELEHGDHQLHHLLRIVGEVLLQLPAQTEVTVQGGTGQQVVFANRGNCTGRYSTASGFFI
jgi:hypothetical protein